MKESSTGCLKGFTNCGQSMRWAGNDTIVVNRTTGEVIAEHRLDPNKDYQRKEQ